MTKSSVKVFAPATIANVGAGFDILGLALEHPGDYIVASKCREKGVSFSVGQSRYAVPEDSRNVVAHIANIMLGELNPPFGMDIVLHKLLPIGSGLGSSGASCAAAAFAVNALLPEPLTRKELIRFALAGEKLAAGSAHADNIAPALLGGVCLIRSYQPLDIIKLPVKCNPFFVIAHPHVIVRTEEARVILPKSLSLDVVVKQTGNLGALIYSLMHGDMNVLKEAIHDEIAEPERSKLIPGFAAVKEAALAAGALAFSISGSGPSVFAIAETAESAALIAKAMAVSFKDAANLDCETFISRINDEGAKIVESC